MKTTRFIAILFLAVLASGCTKDNGGRINIFAEHMTAESNSKVLFDPTDLDAAEWTASETININNHIYSISGTRNNGFSVNTSSDNLGSTLYAIYPGSSFGGNDVTVTNTANGSGSTVVINSLVLNYHGTKHDVVFPMATGGVSSSTHRMTFAHLTGGLKLTLTDNNPDEDYTLGSVKIVTYSDDASATPIAARNGVTARWAVQGPSVPGGMPGSIEGDVSVLYSSEMHFTLKDDGAWGKDIPTGGSISLCVPVTVSSIKSLEVTGYSTTGEQLFVRTKSFGTAKSIDANKMYSIPTIEIN